METNQSLRLEVLKGLKKRWSPDQISKTLREKYPDDSTMRISHESVYTYIYLLPRGVLKKQLISLLRQEKRNRNKRTSGKPKKGGNYIPDMISIEERPAEVADRSLAGDWEGDLIMGAHKRSAIGTLVERKTRAVVLVPLKKWDAASVRKAFEKAMLKFPEHMRRSLTYDQGHEMWQHKLFTKHTKIKVYFCHPYSPWERGTCENTNGLIRDYFPKGTDFSKISTRQLKRVQHELNERPRKTLGYRTPKEVLSREILGIVPLET